MIRIVVMGVSMGRVVIMVMGSVVTSVTRSERLTRIIHCPVARREPKGGVGAKGGGVGKIVRTLTVLIITEFSSIHSGISRSLEADERALASE